MMCCGIIINNNIVIIVIVVVVVVVVGYNPGNANLIYPPGTVDGMPLSPPLCPPSPPPLHPRHLETMTKPVRLRYHLASINNIETPSVRLYRTSENDLVFPYDS